jgi:proteasome lid subunit RPN8/RPN11
MTSLKSLIAAAVDWLRGGTPKVRCNEHVWRNGVAELRRRANGRRESGAFLLGNIENGVRVIRKFLFYDDVDPHCFDKGIVEFNGRLLHVVHTECRKLGMRLVADVHVHPGGHGQSSSDRANPMDPRSGHIAMILPNFAKGEFQPGQFGIYEFQGRNNWIDHSQDGKRFFELTR